MKPYVVTIARENGSGGRAIGHALARKLGVECYNRQLLRLASDESGINEQLFAQADEQFKKTLLFKVARDAYKGEVIPPDSDNFTSNENLFSSQARVIRQLAEAGSSVVIGRCADYVLQDYPYLLRIFIHAPEEARVKALAFRHHVGEDEAARIMEQVDKRRAAYYKAVTGRNWRDAANYDLSLDSDKLGQEGCIDRICAYLKVLDTL